LESKKDLPDKQIKLITKNALETMKYKGDIPAVDYVQQVFGGFIDQISETKPLTEQEIAATMQSVQDQVTQTTGY
jgi:flagellar biosynthesis regulator FlaF